MHEINVLPIELDWLIHYTQFRQEVSLTVNFIEL
jgi:hypothetical protein